MRKEKIHNHYTANFNGSTTLFDMCGSLLRSKSDDGNYSTQYANPIAFKKLKENNRNNTWVGDDATSIVLIDDSRQEIANVAQRGLLTTSMVFNDILQSNRGKQDPEVERNKFFVNDDTTNYRTMLNLGTLGVLDAIWYMREQGIDALEITKEFGNPIGNESKVLSDRYNNLVKEYHNDNYDKVLSICSNAFDHYFATIMKFEDNKGLQLHDEDFDTYSYEGWGDFNYCVVSEDIGKKYLKILRNASRAKLEPISFEKHFAQQVDAMEITQSIKYVLPLLAEKLGYQPKGNVDDETLAERFFKIRTRTWQVIAKSAFKRNGDYLASESNVVKCEVLNLRSKFMESNNG